MKKSISLIVIFVVVALLAFGVAYAVSEKACENSQGPDHASQNGASHASDNSVLNGCLGGPPPP